MYFAAQDLSWSQTATKPLMEADIGYKLLATPKEVVRKLDLSKHSRAMLLAAKTSEGETMTTAAAVAAVGASVPAPKLRRRLTDHLFINNYRAITSDFIDVVAAAQMNSDHGQTKRPQSRSKFDFLGSKYGPPAAGGSDRLQELADSSNILLGAAGFSVSDSVTLGGTTFK